MRIARRGVVVVLMALTLAACEAANTPSSSIVSGGGGSNSGSCSSVGPLGSARGLITATINGASFMGGVSNGGAVYTPIGAQPALGLPAQDLFNITGSCADLTSLFITARATVGTTAIGVDANGVALRDPVTQQPLVHNVRLELRQNAVSAGTWIVSSLGGSGSITVTSVSTVAAVGSFSFTMVPQAGTPASGNKTVTGQFNVTF